MTNCVLNQPTSPYWRDLINIHLDNKITDCERITFIAAQYLHILYQKCVVLPRNKLLMKKIVCINNLNCSEYSTVLFRILQFYVIRLMVSFRRFPSSYYQIMQVISKVRNYRLHNVSLLSIAVLSSGRWWFQIVSILYKLICINVLYDYTGDFLLTVKGRLIKIQFSEIHCATPRRIEPRILAISLWLST